MLKHGSLFTGALALLLALAIRMPALADSQSDPVYAFGTTVVLHSSRQLADPSRGWWGDLLPMEYRFSIGTIVDTVNRARAARGIETMVDVTTYPVNIGGEFTVGSGFEYTIDFQKMFPEDVEIVLTAFPLTGVFSDLRRELRPVRVGYFWGNSQDGAAVTVVLPDGDFVVSPEDSFVEVKAQLASRLSALFGDRARFDLGINRYSNAAMNTESFDVNITVYLDGAEKNLYPMEQDI